MTYPWRKPQFYMIASWPARREEPASIADRLRRFLDTIGTIDETLIPWSVGDRRKLSYPSERDGLTTRVRDDVLHDEMGQVDKDDGYQILCGSQDKRQIYSLIGSAGGVYPRPSPNEMAFDTNGNHAADPAIVTYRLMRAVMLAMIECWEPTECATRSNQITPDWKNEGRYPKPWMIYLPSAQAARVDLVGIPFSERTPDGGLLLSATDEIFRADNPAHVEGARRISQACQVLNAVVAG